MFNFNLDYHPCTKCGDRYTYNEYCYVCTRDLKIYSHPCYRCWDTYTYDMYCYVCVCELESCARVACDNESIEEFFSPRDIPK